MRLPVPWLTRWLVAALGLCGCASASSGRRAAAIEATVVQLNSTGESAPAALVQVRFHNRSDESREIQSYRIEWPGGSFTVDPPDLRVAAHDQVERTARVESRHGDVSQLLKRSSEAKVLILRAR